MSRQNSGMLFQPSEIKNADGFSENPQGWIKKQTELGDKVWLLAFADDGIITGKMDQQGCLITSGDQDPTLPQMDSTTLQRLHLFGENAEIRLWKRDDSWNFCRLSDKPGEENASFDEKYLLWGTTIDDSLDGHVPTGFTPVMEGIQGQHFILPLSASQNHLKRRATLAIRHYLQYNDDGEARIIASRLISLSI